MPAAKISSTSFFVFLLLLCVYAFSCRLKNGTAAASKGSLLTSTIQLGRYLFFDRRLSINNSRSCSTCHNPQFAFTDGYKRSLGAFADLHQRNTEPLFNLAALKYFTAADSTLHTPLQQMLNPLMNDHPAEMGVKGNEAAILLRIGNDARYRQLFADAGLNISWINIKKAISDFIMSIESYDAPYDRYSRGDSAAITTAEKRGVELFFSRKLRCGNCHGGNNFSTPDLRDEKGDTIFYFNTGLYNIDGRGAYPASDPGLFALTKNKADMGKFRVPSLRNLAFTAPYFHDGSAASLSDVIDSYAAGGRTIFRGDDKGNGAISPLKHPFISGFSMSETDRNCLVRFLFSLSDSNLLKEPAYQNPFTSDETKMN